MLSLSFRRVDAGKIGLLAFVFEEDEDEDIYFKVDESHDSEIS